MSRIIVPSRRVWTRQPQRPVGVDWSNPLMAELVLASDPLSLLVLGTNGAPISKWSTNAVETSSPVAMAVDQDLGLCINSTHDFADLTGTNATVSDDSSITFVSVFKTSTFDQVRSYLTRGADGAGSGWSFRISTNTSKLVEAGIVLTSGGTAGYTATSTTTVDGTVVVAAATYDKVDKYLRLYINGELEASVSTGKTGMRSSTIGIRIGGSFTSAGASLGGYSHGKVGPQLVWRRALSASEIERISANVRCGFKSRTSRTIIDLGMSGLSSVYADSALTYYIRSLLSSDSGIQYAIRNAIYKDDAAGYFLRSAIAQNSEVGYVLRSAIAKDDAEAYKIRGLVQSSDAETYSIRGLVQTSDSEAYKIRSQVQADASTSYDIQSSTSVASSNAVNYSVRGAVAASVLVGYSVRGSAQRDAASAYSVRSAVSRDVAASYTVSASVASVYADSTASYSVDGGAPSGPSAESIAAAVLAALQATPIPVDTKKMNGHTIIGDGSESDPWRGVGVSP